MMGTGVISTLASGDVLWSACRPTRGGFLKYMLLYERPKPYAVTIL